MTDPHSELEELLRELESEERVLSASRRRLHDRIAHYPDYTDSDLDARERELSQRRRELHARIDALRVQRTRGREQGGRA